mgnify:CR=1 FL=1
MRAYIHSDGIRGFYASYTCILVLFKHLIDDLNTHFNLDMDIKLEKYI